MRRGARVAAVMAAGVLVGTGTGAVAAPGMAGAVASAPETRPFVLEHEVSCQANSYAGEQIDFRATVRTTGVAPVTVAPGDTVTITAAVAVSLATDLPVTLEHVAYFFGTPNISQWPTHPLADPDQPLTLTARVGASGPLRLGYSWDAALVVLVTTPGSATPMRTNCGGGTGPELSIPVELPADGSLQPVDLSGVGTCYTSDGRFVEVPVGLRGAASARVAPGGQARLIVDYSSASIGGTGDYVQLSLTGDGRSRTFTFTAPYTGVPPALDLRLPAAGAAGVLEVRLSYVTLLIKPPRKYYTPQVWYWCGFNASAPPLRIPISPG